MGLLNGVVWSSVCLDEIVKSINLDLICEKSRLREYQFKNIRHIRWVICRPSGRCHWGVIILIQFNRIWEIICRMSIVSDEQGPYNAWLDEPFSGYRVLKVSVIYTFIYMTIYYYSFEYYTTNKYHFGRLIFGLIGALCYEEEVN